MMRDWLKHIAAEGGSAKLAIRNIVCHLDMMTDEQKAAINWHAEQSVSLAVMRLIAIDDYRKVAQGDPAPAPPAQEHDGKELDVPTVRTDTDGPSGCDGA